MTPSADDLRRKLIESTFRMPAVQTMTSRKSSITNAFVNAIIPVVLPTTEQLAEALSVLQADPSDVRCSYCGDRSTEWDHLRPLVLQRRPTGYISEIANLVPACGKCNQSKGNKPWRDWMVSSAKWSPSGRKIPDIEHRMKRLDVYEQLFRPTRVNFEAIVGHDEWERYWRLCDDIIAEMRECQHVADSIRDRVRQAIKS